MPFDVTGTGTEQDLSVPDTTTVGLYRHTHNQGGGATVDTDQITNLWPALASGVTIFTFGRRNGANDAYVGPVLSVTKDIGATAPPPTYTTPPTLSWQNPTNGALVEGVEDLIYTVDDPSGIQFTEVRINSTLHTPPNGPWDTTAIPNNTAVVLELKAADNSPAHNVTTNSITVTVFNPPVIPPPTSTAKRTILIDLGQDGRQKYALWVPVPASLQVPPPGAPDSQWPGTVPAEQALLDSGAVREIVGFIQSSDLSIDDLHAALEKRWDDENERLLKVAAWPYDDSYWNGILWQKD